MNYSFYTILILMLGMVACKEPPDKNEMLTSKDAIPVVLAPIQQGGLANTIETSGLLYTEDESKLSFKTGGVIESVLVGDGDYVKAGQLLATLKNTEIAAQVSQVKLNVQKAERDYQRIANLYADSVATLEQLQNAKTGLDIAKQMLETATFNQQYARILAPSSGIVVKKLMSAGEIAGPGLPVLVLNHISPSSHWVLKAGLNDVQWASVQLGDKAMVTLDAFPGKTFDAKVTNRTPVADPMNGSFSIELRVNIGSEKPATGMFGKASIMTGQKTYTQVIPYQALLEADGIKGYVFVSNDKKTVQRKEVTIGKMYNDRVEILSGLEKESMVVVTGSAYLNEQSRIIIQQ